MPRRRPRRGTSAARRLQLRQRGQDVAVGAGADDAIDPSPDAVIAPVHLPAEGPALKLRSVIESAGESRGVEARRVVGRIPVGDADLGEGVRNLVFEVLALQIDTGTQHALVEREQEGTAAALTLRKQLLEPVAGHPFVDVDGRATEIGAFHLEVRILELKIGVAAIDLSLVIGTIRRTAHGQAGEQSKQNNVTHGFPCPKQWEVAVASSSPAPGDVSVPRSSAPGRAPSRRGRPPAGRYRRTGAHLDGGIRCSSWVNPRRTRPRTP